MTQPADITAYWDAAAPAFDDESDHGLRDRATRTAWAEFLIASMPHDPADVLDVGCGTGSMSELLAHAGHRVTGVDLSPRMVEQARAKLAAAGLTGRFLVGDAAAPPTGEERFDVLLSRHLVWTLPDPEAALREWLSRLRRAEKPQPDRPAGGDGQSASVVSPSPGIRRSERPPLPSAGACLR